MMNNNEVLSVSQANAIVKDTIEGAFNPFWVSGEIGNLLIHRSGHVYFTLKDARSQIKGCWFGGAAEARKLQLANGVQVESYGKLGVYEVRGEYQINVRQMRLAGRGALLQQFEELRRRLESEGIFDPGRKRPIPQLPARIGVITSPTGAAIRDFLQIINRRFPNVNIVIYPCQVQGNTAAAEVSAGVDFMNRTRACDVMVITRGGGSMEDLWPFNAEMLARAVAASAIPVISAVGHEIDFTICDFAADLRAPTPSAAAELVIGRRAEMADSVEYLAKDMLRCVEMRMNEAMHRVERLGGSYVFREPVRMIEQKYQLTDEFDMRMSRAAIHAVERSGSRIEALENALKMLNPARMLERGYALVTEPETGKVISSSRQPEGKLLSLRFADGTLTVRSEKN